MNKPVPQDVDETDEMPVIPGNHPAEAVPADEVKS